MDWRAERKKEGEKLQEEKGEEIKDGRESQIDGAREMGERRQKVKRGRGR